MSISFNFVSGYLCSFSTMCTDSCVSSHHEDKKLKVPMASIMSHKGPVSEQPLEICKTPSLPPHGLLVCMKVRWHLKVGNAYVPEFTIHEFIVSLACKRQSTHIILGD